VKQVNVKAEDQKENDEGTDSDTYCKKEELDKSSLPYV
jgi:hypothetical protein